MQAGLGAPGTGAGHGTGLTAVPELTRVRSMLFMPGTRADMIAKIPRLAPDVAAVDLEDAVASGDKDSARRTAADAIDALGPVGVSTVLLRVNPVGSPWFAADIAAAAGCAAAGVVVPKLATRDQVRQVRQALADHSRPGALVIAGIETALGVADARTLLAGDLSGAYFGAEDYIADIGGRRSPGGDEVLYARSQVCLAAYLAGIPAIDQVVTDIADDGRFVLDARRGQALGYQGKMCIHPRQIGLAHQVFTPTPEEVAHARAVVAAGAEGVGVVGGQMVDDVHVRMARAVLARAAEPPGPAGPPGPADSAVSTAGTSEFKRVLIANRGEIALRVVRACRDAGMASIAVYADPDERAPFAVLADEATGLAGTSPAETYLSIGKLLAAAERTGADAVHPGYGFLAENASFAQAVLNARPDLDRAPARRHPRAGGQGAGARHRAAGRRAAGAGHPSSRRRRRGGGPVRRAARAAHRDQGGARRRRPWPAHRP